MDSANTSGGSLQSSSGADDEYDSRAESSSSFSASFMLNNNNNHNHHHVGLGLSPFTTTTSNATTAINNFANSHTLPPQQQHHHIMFDPLSNYMDPMQQRSPPPSSLSISSNHPNASSLLNLDMMWSTKLLSARSEPNPGDLIGGSLVPPPPSQLQLQEQQQQSHALLLSPGQPTRDNNSDAAFHAPLPPDSQQEGSSRGHFAANNNNDQQPHNSNNNSSSSNRNMAVRNPKKRSRASRRAPTTVLTTDTTNFRAMVQEFTGIPAQPFTSSTPFPRTRFDLFASAPPVSSSSCPSSLVRTTLLDPSSLPPYLLRPFAQKLHNHPHLHPFPPPSSSNSVVESLLASNNFSTNSVTNNSTSIADQLSLLKQHPLNFNNNNSPILSFQQSPPKYPLGINPSSLDAAASKTQHTLEIPPPSSGHSHLRVGGVFEELGGLSGGDLHHQNMVSSSGNNNNNNNSLSINASTEWGQRSGTITNDDREQGGDGVTVNYNNVAERSSARSEGMVESWINCSSDN